jgi:chromosome segregation ATPase
MHLTLRFIFITCVIIWDLCLCIKTEAEAHDNFMVSVLTELSQLQNQFVASERYYREKLATVEEQLHESENVRVFYQNKVAEIEKQLQASKETEISYKKKLEHVEDLLDQTEQRLTNAELTIQTLISTNKKLYNNANNNLIIEQTDASYQTGPVQSTISAPYQNKSFTTFQHKRQGRPMSYYYSFIILTIYLNILHNF